MSTQELETWRAVADKLLALAPHPTVLLQGPNLEPIASSQLDESSQWITTIGSEEAQACLSPLKPEGGPSGIKEWLLLPPGETRYWVCNASEEQVVVKLHKEYLGASPTGIVVLTLESQSDHTFIPEFRKIHEATRRFQGQEYFQELTKALAELFQCKCCCISAKGPLEEHSATTVAFTADGVSQPNFCYKLQGTPCEKVLSPAACFLSTGVGELFPEDSELAQAGIDSYYGVPLLSVKGEPIGLLCLMHDGPLFASNEMRWVLEVFAASAAAQMQQLQAESTLRESRERFEAIFRLAPDALFLLDAEGVNAGTIVDANLQAAKLHGYEVEELIGMHITEVDAPRDAPKAKGRIAQLREGHRLVFDITHRRKDGELFPMRVSAECITLAGHSYVLAFNHDITEETRVLEQLKQSEERLSLSVDAGDIGIWDWNLLTDNVHFSERWKRQLGHTGDEVGDTLKEFMDRVHPDDAALVRDSLDDYFNDRTDAYNIECRLRHKDGSYRWIHTRGVKQNDGEGKVVRILGCHIDISDAKHADMLLRESDERWRTVFEDAPVAMLIVSLAEHNAGTVIEANRAAVELHGFDEGAMAGMHVHELDRIVDKEATRKRIQRIRGGETVVFEVDHKRRDGSFFPTEIVARKIILNGTPYTFAILTDTSERREFQQTIRKREGEIAHGSRVAVLGEAIAEIAHEVNQPLYAISNFANATQIEVAADDITKEDLAARLDKINSLALDGSKIIDRIRGFLKKGQAEPKAFPIAKVVDDALELLSFGYPNSRIQTEHAQAAGDLLVRGDELQLQQALVNIVKNSIEATEERPESDSLSVLVQSYQEGDDVCVSVTDQGVGIPQELGEQIFDAFRSSKQDGMGMGLSISRTIIESHGGAIWFTSRPHEGTTMHFRLPTAATR